MGAMKKFLPVVIAAIGLALAAGDVDAAKRFGGGGNLGRQRPAPTARETAPASPASPTAAPAKPAQPAATTPPVVQPQPTFMSRFGGLLVGLGIGALLASLFGAQMGPVVGLILFALAAFVAVALLMRLLTGRRAAAAPPVRFAGIATAVNEPPSPFAPRIEPVMSNARAIPDAEVEAFLRVAKTSFIRLQAAKRACVSRARCGKRPMRRPSPSTRYGTCARVCGSATPRGSSRGSSNYLWRPDAETSTGSLSPPGDTVTLERQGQGSI